MCRLDSSGDENTVVPIRYTAKERTVEGYTAEIREELTAYEDSETMYAAYRFVITNTHTPGTIDVTVQKNWVDGNSKDRPGSVTVQLYADGQACGEPVTLTREDGWTYTWHVPAKADGRDIVYTVKETDVPKGYTATYSEDTLTITNTLKEIPATGDSSALWLYAGIFAASASAAAVFLIFRKKRRQE